MTYNPFKDPDLFPTVSKQDVQNQQQADVDSTGPGGHLGHILDVVSQALSNVPTDTAGFLGDLAQDAQAIVAPGPKPVIPGSGPVSQAAQAAHDAVLPGDKGVTRGERIAASGARMAGDAVALAPEAPVGAAVSGAASGVAGQLADEVAPDNPTLHILAMIAGGLTPAAAKLAVTRAPQAVAQILGRTNWGAPVQGRITSGFGAREAPTAGASTYHQGVDIAVPVGTPVKAPAPGVVDAVGHGDPKRGNWVELKHPDGTTTRYFHLSEYDVKPGDEVSAGEAFAKSGATGNVTGPHLHWSAVDANGHPFNPLELPGHPIGGGGSVGASVPPMNPKDIAKIMGGQQDDAELAALASNDTSSEGTGPFGEPLVRDENGFDQFGYDRNGRHMDDFDENGSLMDSQEDSLTPSADILSFREGQIKRAKELHDILDGHIDDLLNNPNWKLTPAERQEMDASVPDYGNPPEAVDARTIGQGADYSEQVPANDDVHSLPYASLENAEKGYNDWLENVIQSQGPHSDPKALLTKDDYHPFNPDQFNAIKGAAESGNAGAEETLAQQYGVSIRNAPEEIERDPNPPAASSTFGTARPEGINRKPPTKSPEGHDEQPSILDTPMNENPDESPVVKSAEEKLADAMNKARPITNERKEQLHNLRVEQDKKLAAIQARGGTTAEMKSALKGGLPDYEYEPLEHGLTEAEEKALRNKVNAQRGIGRFDKLHVHEALDKLLNPKGLERLTEGDLKNLSGVFGPKLVRAVMNRVSPTGDPGLFNKVWNTVNAAKTIGDLSDLTKSNATMFLTPGYWKTLGRMAKGGFFTGKSYERLREATRSNPDYDLVKQMGLSHTGQGEVSGEHEEIFKQNFLEHIPGVRNVMHASERMYSGIANEVRDHAALKMLARDRRAGIDVTNSKYLKDAGELVNTLTGRASFGASKLGNAAERAMPFLSKVLWTPRQYASWVKMAGYAANPKWWMKASPAMRIQLASGFVSLAGWTVANLSMASYFGYEVHKNILDPLFGKYKIGDTIYDASAGRGSTLHAIATALSGYILKDGEVQGLGDNPHANLKTRGDVVMHWMRTHASPAAAMVENEFMGKDFAHPVDTVGNEQDWTDWKHRDKNPLYQAVTPMSGEGVWDAIDHQGVNKQTVLTGIGEMAGIQSNTEKPRESSSKGKALPGFASGYNPFKDPDLKNYNPFKDPDLKGV